MRVTTSRATDKPNPTPSVFAVTNGSNTASPISAGGPAPESLIVSDNRLSGHEFWPDFGSSLGGEGWGGRTHWRQLYSNLPRCSAPHRLLLCRFDRIDQQIDHQLTERRCVAGD